MDVFFFLGLLLDVPTFSESLSPSMDEKGNTNFVSTVKSISWSPSRATATGPTPFAGPVYCLLRELRHAGKRRDYRGRAYNIFSLPVSQPPVEGSRTRLFLNPRVPQWTPRKRFKDLILMTTPDGWNIDSETKGTTPWVTGWLPITDRALTGDPWWAR